MADKRMFSNSVVMSDAFLDMPASARALYFTLGMSADDEGFVGNPKSIVRLCGASLKDLDILIEKRYLLKFPSEVIVIKHWKMNNIIRNDRSHETTYLEERSMLEIDNRGAYTEKGRHQDIQNGFDFVHSQPSDRQPATKCQPSDNQDDDAEDAHEQGIATTCQPSDNQMSTKCQPNDNQVTSKCPPRLDYIRLDNNNNIYSAKFELFWERYPRKRERGSAEKAFYDRIKAGEDPDKLIEAATNYADECKNIQREERYIKLGASFLSKEKPYDDYFDENYSPLKVNKALKSDHSGRIYDFKDLERMIE